MPPLHEYVVAPVPDSVTVLPAHTLVDVAEIPTTGNGLTVINWVAVFIHPVAELVPVTV